MSDTVTFMAVGDTAPSIDPPTRVFEQVKEPLSEADFAFSQVERTFSTSGTYNEISLGAHSMYDPKYLEAYDDAGFDVVGLASNHSLDWGPEALLETIDRFEDVGIQPVGAGRTISDAREPFVFEQNGVRVALLGYGSVLLPQYWATEERPGCAPLRARTYYEQVDYQPGTPPRIVTRTWQDDLDALKTDIEAANQGADAVVLSCHWGVHFRPKHIADYQREIAQTAIDAGCDLIFGHHPHLLHGVEFYGDVPCVYSIGNFAMTPPTEPRKRTSYVAPNGDMRTADLYSAEYGPNLQYHHKDHFAKSVMLCAELGEDGCVGLTLHPAYVTAYEGESKGGQPVKLDPDDPRFSEVVEFVKWSSDEFDDTGFEVDEDAIRIHKAPE